MSLLSSGSVASRPTILPRLLLLAYIGGAVFVFIGFTLHRSSVRIIGPYTPGYVVFLALVFAGLLFPAVMGVVSVRRLGGRRSARLASALGLVLLMGYAGAEVVYASIRRHPFDPFLQFPGARFDSIPLRAEPGVTRVVAIGGSTTRDAYVDPPMRYPRVLEAILNERTGTGRFQVLNAGMDWWTSKHSHINYVTYLRAWTPDVAVVMHGVNDLYRSFSPPRFSVGPYDSQWSHFYGPAIRGARPGTLLGSLLGSWSMSELDRRWYARWRYQQQDYDLSAFKSLDDFEFNLRSLTRTLKADGVRVILLTEPSLYKSNMNPQETARLWFPSMYGVQAAGVWARLVPSADAMARAMAAYGQVVLRVGAEEGVEVLDLAERFPKTLEYLGDDVHYTERGSELVAREVARILAEPKP
jgi:lysophospholipase L1-like esterase